VSLAIDVEKVTEVLIGDCWFEVEPRSFTLDSYEFIEPPDEYDPELDHAGMGRAHWESQYGFTLHGGGQSGVCATGFVFAHAKQGGAYVAGPLTAVSAVKYGVDWSRERESLAAARDGASA